MALPFQGLSPPSGKVTECEQPSHLGQHVTNFPSVIIPMGDLHVVGATRTCLVLIAGRGIWSEERVDSLPNIRARCPYVWSCFGQLGVREHCAQLCPLHPGGNTLDTRSLSPEASPRCSQGTSFRRWPVLCPAVWNGLGNWPPAGLQADQAGQLGRSVGMLASHPPAT